MSKYANIPPGINPRDELEPIKYTSVILTTEHLGKMLGRLDRSRRREQRRREHQKRKQ